MLYQLRTRREFPLEAVAVAGAVVLSSPPSPQPLTPEAAVATAANLVAAASAARRQRDGDVEPDWSGLR